jgi:hypothetical protein
MESAFMAHVAAQPDTSGIPSGSQQRTSISPQQVAFLSALLERTQAIPGVSAAALVMCAPLSGGC